MKVGEIYAIFNYVLSFVLANSGVISFKTNPELWPIGLSFIVASFLILYLLNYISKIKENEDEIKIMKEEINMLKQNLQTNEKLLNTLRDVILLRGKR